MFIYIYYTWIGIIFTVFAHVQFRPFLCEPVTFDWSLLIQPLPRPVFWSPRSTLSWLVHCLISEANMRGDWRYHQSSWASLGHTALCLWLYAHSGWLYEQWSYWTKLIVAYEYCWGVLSNRAVFLICVMGWFSVGAGIYHVPVLFVMLVWFSNDRDTAVVTDLRQDIHCLGRIAWSMYVQ